MTSNKYSIFTCHKNSLHRTCHAFTTTWLCHCLGRTWIAPGEKYRQNDTTLMEANSKWQQHFKMHFLEWKVFVVFLLGFHRSLFLRVQLIISHHWFRQWLGDKQATSHYLNQWWPTSTMPYGVTRAHGVNMTKQNTIMPLKEAPYPIKAPLKGCANHHKIVAHHKNRRASVNFLAMGASNKNL